MKVNKELIQRYHLKQCTPEEAHAVKEWLEFEETEESFPEEKDMDVLEERGWKKISTRYAFLNERTVQPVRKSGRRIFSLRKVLQAAACITLIFIGIHFYRYTSSGGFWKEGHKEPAVLVYKEIKTLAGQKLQVKLPDGTMVWLNSESKLRFPVNFSGHSRLVSFAGEAYFKVAKNPLKSFIITTPATRVRVLGTRFNLRAYTGEESTSVVVEEGKVCFSVLHTKDQQLLTANQKGTFRANVQASEPVLKMEQVYAARYLGWKNNQLILDDLPLNEIKTTLERWYGVKIQIKNSKLSRERYTGTFADPSLKQVLESISFALKCSYKTEKNVCSIY